MFVPKRKHVVSDADRCARDSPPKDDPFTPEELAQYNGSDDSKPVYVAIKGKIFDVSEKRDMYRMYLGRNSSHSLY